MDALVVLLEGSYGQRMGLPVGEASGGRQCGVPGSEQGHTLSACGGAYVFSVGSWTTAPGTVDYQLYGA